MSELDPILDSLFRSPFAPAPSLGQLERRRQQRRRRRATSRVAVLACVALGLLVVSRSQNTATHTVNTIDGDHRPTTTVQPSPSPSNPASAASSEGAAGASPGPDLTTPAVAGVTAATQPTTTTPGAVGCSAQSDRNAVDVTTPFGGAGTGGYQNQCEYTATQIGGYVAHGADWRVEVERGSAYFVYATNGSKACGDLGTIQPGDHVVLTITYGSEAAADPAYARAGPDQHC